MLQNVLTHVWASAFCQLLRACRTVLGGGYKLWGASDWATFSSRALPDDPADHEAPFSIANSVLGSLPGLYCSRVSIHSTNTCKLPRVIFNKIPEYVPRIALQCTQSSFWSYFSKSFKQSYWTSIVITNKKCKLIWLFRSRIYLISHFEWKYLPKWVNVIFLCLTFYQVFLHTVLSVVGKLFLYMSVCQYFYSNKHSVAILTCTFCVSLYSETIKRNMVKKVRGVNGWLCSTWK